MKYISKPTAKNNVGISYVSQEDADKQAALMDQNNCINCTYCTNCAYCHNCINCNNCHSCSYCTNCHNCNNCHNCTNCHNCHDCDNCINCNNCTYCKSQPVQIQGLKWTVTIRADNTIKIGCQDLSRTFWEKASDDTIAQMDKDALKFWQKYKQLILSFPAPIPTKNI